MRLYYMTAQKWAEKILREQRFKLSTFDELNDPFELLGASIGERRARHLFKIVYEHWTKTLGILCTGTSWDSPVMWAHYGDKHRGVCIGFDVAEGAQPHQVTYRPDRLRGLIDHIGEGRLLTQEQLMSVLTTKFKDWEYEREWRLFASLHTRDQEDGKSYLTFHPHLTVREVILGARCEGSVGQFAELIQNPLHPVEIFKARAAFDSFRMVRQKQVKSIVVKPIKPRNYG